MKAFIEFQGEEHQVVALSWNSEGELMCALIESEKGVNHSIFHYADVEGIKTSQENADTVIHHADLDKLLIWRKSE